MIYTLENRRVEWRGTSFYIAHNATLIGSVIVEDEVSVWFNAVVRGDNDVIVLGAKSNVQDGAVLHTDPGLPLQLGVGVTVGHQATLHGCIVEDYSLVGIHSVVLNGARIGRFCLIGANTLIPEGKVIPEGSLVLGSPGRVVRTLDAGERQRLVQSAQGYIDKLYRYRQGFATQTRGQ
ncbi:MAG: gamma carbonic anhydrase family protein [Candidatus Competibacterales bacterium]